LPCLQKKKQKHSSPQFLGSVTFVPGSQDLEVISCGQPIVNHGSDGKAFTHSMKAGFNESDITAC